MIIENILTGRITKPDKDLASSNYRNSQLIDLAIDSRYPDPVNGNSVYRKNSVHRKLNFEELEQR